MHVHHSSFPRETLYREKTRAAQFFELVLLWTFFICGYFDAVHLGIIHAKSSSGTDKFRANYPPAGFFDSRSLYVRGAVLRSAHPAILY